MPCERLRKNRADLVRRDYTQTASRFMQKALVTGGNADARIAVSGLPAMMLGPDTKLARSAEAHRSRLSSGFVEIVAE